MASLNKQLYETWMAQNALSTIEENFAANFAALERLNAGKRMNTGNGNLEVQFESSVFWNGLNQRALYLRAYMLIEPSYETSALPVWANVINQVDELPSSSFNEFFKIVTP